jgi:ABC-type transport system substrate-binding protein
MVPICDQPNRAGHPYAFDPKKAGAMLDAAGYPLKDGKRFSLEFTYTAVSPFNTIAKSVAAQWKEVGVDTKLVRLDSQIWTDKVYRKKDFDVSLISPHRAVRPALGPRSELPLQRGPCALYETKGLLQSGARPHRARGGLGECAMIRLGR